MRFSIFSFPMALEIIKHRRGSMPQVEMRTFPGTQFGNTFKDDRTTQWNIIQNSWEYKQNAIALTNAGAFQRRHPCCVSTWPSNPTPSHSSPYLRSFFTVFRFNVLVSFHPFLRRISQYTSTPHGEAPDVCWELHMGSDKRYSCLLGMASKRFQYSFEWFPSFKRTFYSDRLVVGRREAIISAFKKI